MPRYARNAVLPVRPRGKNKTHIVGRKEGGEEREGEEKTSGGACEASAGGRVAAER